MLEIQPIIYEKSVVKRSPQYSQEQQYQAQAAPESVPPEYISLLQQLQAQQSVGAQQPEPVSLHQVLISRQPQTFTGQPRPPTRRLTPEQEQQRRLQENIAQKSIREQEARDAQRQQQAQLQRLYQGAQLDPAYLAQLQQAQQQYAQLPETRQLVQIPQQPVQAPQYVQASASPQPQYIQIPQAQPEPQPERLSYSQVQFGSTKLPRRLTKLLPQPVQASSYVQPQPQTQSQPQRIVYAQPQQEVYIQPKTQQVVYSQPSQEIVYSSQNDIYQQQARRAQAEVKPTSLPQQYLIETTKVEPQQQQQQQQQVVQIPKQRPQIYYRPQPSYQDIQASILAQQQQAQYAQQQLEAATTTTATPSRSSIYVSTLTTQKTPQLRLSKPDTQRPLSQNELNSLINAGFKVSPSSSAAPEYTYQPQYTYYREIGKRQNRPIPRPVQLTSEERKALEKEGIRNLYRVETAESNDSPVTYVLALSSRPK
ncbi:hypothetical protein O3M35_000441 [Rhynocoris fuscipes]|uniref:Uncharacterized protein n=1 Tax=Rhynocoris fuscipes TaxID=488301 RepID=A0AAW1DNQ9_9HEMI